MVDFLLFTAMLKNFYQYLLSKVSAIFPGIDMKSRLKRFVFAVIDVDSKGYSAFEYIDKDGLEKIAKLISPLFMTC